MKRTVQNVFLAAVSIAMSIGIHTGAATENPLAVRIVKGVFGDALNPKTEVESLKSAGCVCQGSDNKSRSLKERNLLPGGSQPSTLNTQLRISG